jgi:protein-L-isoaspartate(D-aspartate) O-methyltransferase
MVIATLAEISAVDREAELAIVRRAFAKQVMASVGGHDPATEEAFACVPRERYLGPGPWPILRFTD